MKESWIEKLWTEKSNTNTLLHATDICFEVHKVPPFYELKIASMGLGKDEEKKAEMLIDLGGGYYRGSTLQAADIIIMKKDAAGMNIREKIECLDVEWVFHSAEQKAALPFDNYRIEQSIRPDINTQMMFLQGMRIHIHGFEEEQQEIVEICVNSGAMVTQGNVNTESVDILMLPMGISSMEDIKVIAKCIINELWLVRILLVIYNYFLHLAFVTHCTFKFL